MILNFLYDPSVSSAPNGFTATLDKVASFFDNTFSDPVTVNIEVGYGEIGGQPLASGALAESSTSIEAYTYSQIKSALAADAKTSVDSSVVASLPASNPTSSNYIVASAEAKALNLPTGSGLDGAIGFAAANFAYDNSNGVPAGQYDFFGVVSHEVSEVMGRFLMTGQGGYSLYDLLHFSAPNTRTFSTGGYFSADNGVTNSGTFNTNSSGDSGDWASSVGPDAFLAFAQSGTVLPVSANDVEVMDALGWDSSTTPPILVSTSPADNATAVATGANLVLTFNEPVKAGTGNIVIRQFSDGSPVATIAIGDSSQVSFSGATVTINPLLDLAFGAHYYVTVDSGAIQGPTGSAFAGVLTNTAFEFTTALPPPTSPIATSSNTTLALAPASGLYYLLDSTGAGPTLKDYSGADYVAGEFNSWNPIGAVKTATGYEVAWKNTDTDQFTLWSTDNNANFTGFIASQVSGSDPTIISAETLFQLDLNGDGSIGNPPPPVTTPIATSTNTTLALAPVSGLYYLLDGTGAGPTLKDYSGADYVAGEFNSWNPIGAVKTATGYEVAWKNTDTDQFTLWSTDNNANFTGFIASQVSGSDPAIISAETLFQLDLNGDGSIGNPPPPVTTPIATSSNTTLALAPVSGLYYLLDSTGAGPTLKDYSGADYVAGEFNSWNPIGAVKTATGYEVAWKNTDTDQFTLWSTDNNANFTGFIASQVSGSDPAIISAETLFQLDLNGDGSIGNPPTTPIATSSNTTLALAPVSGLYYLLDSTGAGPTLKDYSGADYVAGEFNSWNPIGAVKTATGYEVAWKNMDTDQFTLWSTDNNANFTGFIASQVSGSDPAIISAETLFQLDLNGDGSIGNPPTTPIATSSNTTLALAPVSGLYYLLDSTGAGPTLKDYSGADYVAGEFNSWNPIGAVKTATGYEVAWKNMDTDQFTLWSTDNNANFTGFIASQVSGSDPTIISAETLFQLDLNGDGSIGNPPPPVTTPIATSINTTLATAANHYYLLDSAGAGPSLEYNGADVVSGEFGNVDPIGAVKTASGYEIAWKATGADAYALWSTDSSGNYIANLVGSAPGSYPAIISAETLFQQDLNGDRYIGSPPTVVNSLATSSNAVSEPGIVTGTVVAGAGAALEQNTLSDNLWQYMAGSFDTHTHGAGIVHVQDPAEPQQSWLAANHNA